MLNESADVTVSEPNLPPMQTTVRKLRSRKQKFAKGLFFFLGVLIIATIFLYKNADAPVLSDKTNAKLGSRVFQLDIADTPDERRQGLSGRPNMAANSGMLFIFDKAERQCIWMKDMHFSLDIIWADANKNITHIEQNVSPQSYPRAYCGAGGPDTYVIELNSGAAMQNNIKLGDRIQF